MTASPSADFLPRLLKCISFVALAAVLDLRAADFTVTASAGSSAYTINGMGGNPMLTLERGKTYTFQISTTSSHPFRINSSGVINNAIFSGTLTYTVPMVASNYTYRCTLHSFGGNINTVAPSTAPPTVQILSLTVGTNLVIKSTGTNNWSVFPEFKTNLAATNWFALTVQSNRFVGGTNETFCGRPPGTNVFIRVRNASGQ